MKKTVKLLFRFVQFTILLGIPVSASGQTLQDIVTKTFEEFKPSAEVFGVHLGHVVFSETLHSHVSNGSPDIVVNLSQLSKYTAGDGTIFTRQFIKYVLAHEIGHKIQFNAYNLAAMGRSKALEKSWILNNIDFRLAVILHDEKRAFIDGSSGFWLLLQGWKKTRFLGIYPEAIKESIFFCEWDQYY